MDYQISVSSTNNVLFIFGKHWYELKLLLKLKLPYNEYKDLMEVCVYKSS